jgi:hypothetical protein
VTLKADRADALEIQRHEPVGLRFWTAARTRSRDVSAISRYPAPTRCAEPIETFIASEC